MTCTCHCECARRDSRDARTPLVGEVTINLSKCVPDPDEVAEMLAYRIRIAQRGGISPR